jgi:hypothetical protein
MRRIYFLAPNIETTHKIVDELRAEGIEGEHAKPGEAIITDVIIDL